MSLKIFVIQDLLKALMIMQCLTTAVELIALSLFSAEYVQTEEVVGGCLQTLGNSRLIQCHYKKYNYKIRCIEFKRRLYIIGMIGCLWRISYSEGYEEVMEYTGEFNHKKHCGNSIER